MKKNEKVFHTIHFTISLLYLILYPFVVVVTSSSTRKKHWQLLNVLAMHQFLLLDSLKKESCTWACVYFIQNVPMFFACWVKYSLQIEIFWVFNTSHFFCFLTFLYLIQDDSDIQTKKCNFYLKRNICAIQTINAYFDHEINFLQIHFKLCQLLIIQHLRWNM